MSPKYDIAYIEPVGDDDVDSGRYKNGKLEVCNLNSKAGSSYGDYDSITRYTFNRQGKVISQKIYAD